MESALVKSAAVAARTCGLCGISKGCLPGSTEFKLIHDLELYVRHLGPLHRGQHLFREGDPISGLLIVQSGCLKLYGVDQAGREYIPGFRLPGDTVGLHGFFTGRHQFNAVALSTSVICQIDHTHLQEIIGRIPTLMPSILRKVGQEMINSVFLSGNFTAEERVTAFLVNLHEKLQKSASSGEINLPMTRGDIAVFLHLASATVSRILSRLERNGVITTDLHHIQLLDLPRLQCLCMNVPFATQQVG